MRIQHNIIAMNSYRNFSANNSKLSKNLEKLSSGYAINRAGDDAAGLAISEKMRAQISGIEGATKNAKDGISLIQTAEGALTEVHDMLNRMTTLAEQSANGTYQNELDREQLQKEVEALKSEIDRIADSTNFNGLKLLDGNLGGSSTGTIDGLTQHSVDPVDNVQTITAAALTASDAAWTDGDVIETHIGFNDGSSATVKLTAKIDNATKITKLVDDNGKVFGEIAAASGPAVANRATTDIASALAQALKDTDYGDIYKISAAAGVITATAREAGSGKLEINSIAMEAYAASDTTRQTNLFVAEGVATSAKVETTTKGKGEMAAFKATDVIAYDSTKDNASEAVFTVNGEKFAIGKIDQDVTKLDSDVTFIGVAGGSSGASFETSASTASSVASIKVTADEAKQIAHIISQKTGMNVEFAASNTKLDGAATATATVFTVEGKISTAKSGEGLTLQIGDTSDKFNKLTVSVGDMHSKAIGIGDVDISTQEGASKALDAIKQAVNNVSDTRGNLGALQNRLDHTINNLGVMRENIQNAESTIRDTDVAEEMMTYTKNSILNQSAQAMLAQANQLPQGVLQLLQ